VFILLDIDGVMLPAKSWQSPAFLEDGFPAFTLNAVRSLNTIIQNTNATIVLTTSHKDRFDNLQWSTIFSQRGITAKIQKCEYAQEVGVSRADLVLSWLEANPSLENFVIIDDDKSLNDLPSNVKQHLIMTSSYIGLNDSLAELAVERLTHN
jgi:hypothetical protein